MAESALKSSVNLLGKVLVEEGKYLWGAEGQVKELRDELLWMRSFLRKADALQYKDEIVTIWICQVQEYVSEAEDIIDKFVIKVVSHRQQYGLLNKLKRYSCIFRELYDLHQVASNIDSLIVKISTLSPRLEKYGLMRTHGINTDEAANETRTEQVQQIMRNFHMEDKKIVGFEKNTKEIINALKSKSTKWFHAIYGMGGLGKTTLATKVLKDDETKQHFPGGQTFAYVSKKFQVETVLQDLLKGLSSGSIDKNEEEKEKKSTADKLREILKMKKCLVVLDDVWRIQDWDRLKYAFSSCGGDSGSKVLLTTRIKEVATFVDLNALQKPDLLNEEESWELLQKIMNFEQSTSSGNEQAQSTTNENKDDVQQMEIIKNKIFKIYKGLPLAIVVHGGILRKKRTWTEKKSVLENISSHLLTGYDHGRSCKEILLMSYNDLSYQLKPCFLHLANFPEDYEIKTENLYWMWVAEGLVTRSSDRTSGTKSVEDVANDYLNDLAQAGLVEIVKASEGWIESVRMHDLVRDVCVEEATSSSFVKRVDLRSCPDQELDTSDYYSEKRLLRMAVYLPDEGSIKDCLSSKASKYLRSLLFISNRYTNKGESQPLMTCICSEFQMLRVLVLKGLDLRDGGLTGQVANLMHLRYLSFKGADVSEFPSSIGNLRFLEILDLRVDEAILPNILWKLFRLRHLLLPDDYEIKSRSKRLRVDTLICLETIENLQVKKLRTKDMRGIKRLRRLSITDVVSKEVFADITPALKSGRLSSCFLKVEGGVVTNNIEILSIITCNCDLRIVGRISIPEGKTFEYIPQHLEKLTLEGCALKYDPMKVLGSLCHLKTLELGDDCYVGEKMSCSSESFPLLAKLEMFSLKKLEVWELEHGSMPKLSYLLIRECNNLKRIPDVLPLSLNCLYSMNRSVTYPNDVNFESGIVQFAKPREFDEYWKSALVTKGECDKVVLLMGKSGMDMASYATKFYLHNDVNRHFDVVANTKWIPRRCGGGGGLPRRSVLQQLLRDMNPKLSREKEEEELAQMSSHKLITHIQQVIQVKKCLVILEALNSKADQYLEEDLDKVFGHGGLWFQGTKIVFISDSDEEPHPVVVANCCVVKFRSPTHLKAWKMLEEEGWKYSFFAEQGWEYIGTNAGIKWNMMRHCLGHPLSADMIMGLLKRKKNITEWSSEHKELLINSSPIEFSRLFALCYNDLHLPLRQCLIYLANFPEDVEISAKKLYQLWISADFIESKQDNVQTAEASLENVAISYLTELMERGMVTVVKRGLAERVQLKFELRDFLLTKAKEEHVLMIDDDQFEHTTSTTNANLETQHLNEIYPASPFSDEQLHYSLDFVCSRTSLLFFPNVSYPLYNEEKWEWLLYICNHFQLLRILDLEGIWMTKGCFPNEIENLTHLRFLSLRGTWVTQLPSSIGSLINLQTLDLRVMESIVIPDVLWKLYLLMHLYLPADFIAQDSPQLRLHGLSDLQMLANLQTDKVCLSDLLELKLLRKISIKKTHASDEFVGVLNHLNSPLDMSISSEIINVYQNILSRLQNLQKLKIKGTLLVELRPDMFPTQLKDLALKNTKLEQDPLPVLEKLPQLRSLALGHESFLGKKMTFSEDFCERTNLLICSLSNLEELYCPLSWFRRPGSIEIMDCWRVEEKRIPSNEMRDEGDEQLKPRCFDLSPLKKVMKDRFC